jgi:hypothetical protein
VGIHSPTLQYGGKEAANASSRAVWPGGIADEIVRTGAPVVTFFLEELEGESSVVGGYRSIGRNANRELARSVINDGRRHGDRDKPVRREGDRKLPRV